MIYSAYYAEFCMAGFRIIGYIINKGKDDAIC